MKKILIIEDEKIVRNLMKKKLVEKGFQVELAKNGEEGLQKIKSEHPNLILLDIIMPKMNGFEVLEGMEGTEFVDIPVVIVSNSGQPVEIDKAKEYGVKDWIVKTEFDPEEVIEKAIEQIGNPKNK
jgi:CheY-like chemotaxis protein